MHRGLRGVKSQLSRTPRPWRQLVHAVWRSWGARPESDQFERALGRERIPTLPDAKRFSLTVNGRRRDITATPDMPLLWALRQEVGLSGVKFGCGAGLCGAC